ncbi:MAG: hypothetical protein HY815_08495 [Candidatus Riflebacteria bacterium]|nr:hypothetical protein [Candidatus Riflebacteria bacterium]
MAKSRSRTVGRACWIVDCAHRRVEKRATWLEELALNPASCRRARC